MEQELIKKLLEEASTSNFLQERQTDILHLLTNAAFREKHPKVSAGMQTVVCGLFMDVAEHHPEIFPALFPVFAVMCGDCDEDGPITAQIEWQCYDLLSIRK